MAKIDESQLGDDFRYILRLAMADVDGMKPIGLGLTSIYGVGQRTAIALCGLANVDAKKMGGLLSDAETDSLTEAIEAYPTAVPLWMVNRQRDLHSGDELHLFSQAATKIPRPD